MIPTKAITSQWTKPPLNLYQMGDAHMATILVVIVGQELLLISGFTGLIVIRELKWTKEGELIQW